MESNWVKNRTADGGAQDKVIQFKMPHEIVLKSWTNKHGSAMWGSTAPDKLDKLVKSNKGLYEVLTTYPQKVYFDIDKDDHDDYEHNYDYLTKVKSIISEHFHEPDMAVSGSCGLNSKGIMKTSYHIVLNNYILKTHEDKQILKQFVRYISQEHDAGFDYAVYSRNQNLKMINQSKRDDPRIQSILDDMEPKKHIVSGILV